MREGDADTLRSIVRTAFPALKSSSWASREDGTQAVKSDRKVSLRRGSTRPLLFGYQRELSRDISLIVEGRERALLALPTGGGKTSTAVAAILDSFSAGTCRRVIWLAPSIELLDQAGRTFAKMWRDCGAAPDLDLIRSISTPLGGVPCVLMATPQALYSQMRRKQPTWPEWDVVVFDEAHQLGASTFRLVIDRLMSNSNHPALIGLSATPGRVEQSETEDLVELFAGRLLTSRQLRPNPIATLQRRGVLSKIEFREVVDYKQAPQDEGGRLVLAAQLAADLGHQDRHVLVFTASVAGAVVLSEAVQSTGVSSRAVHASMPDSARSDAVEAFGRGDVRVLVNQKLLATGYDCPAVSDLILVGAVGSPILFEQIVGRAARGPKTGGMRTSRVWQFDDHLALHGLPQSYYRFRDFDWS